MKFFFARVCRQSHRLPPSWRPFPLRRKPPPRPCPSAANAARPAAPNRRQSHLLALHRRERPAPPPRPAPPQPACQPSRGHRNPPPRTPSARPSPSPPSTSTCISAPPITRSPSAPWSPCATTASPALPHLPLQISSSLNWEQIRVAGQTTSSLFPVATLNSDADHTGQLHEAAVPLAAPLAPGASLQLDVTYSGAIDPNAQRLLAIGTPEDLALHSDWDRSRRLHRPARLRQRRLVSGLQRSRHPRRRRPPLRRDGRAQAPPRRRALPPAPHRRVSPRPAAHRRRSSTAIPPPSPSPTRKRSMPNVAGVATAQPRTPPSSALRRPASSSPSASRTPAPTSPPGHCPTTTSPSRPGYRRRRRVTPFLQGWLGQHPRAQLTLLDLPDPERCALRDRRPARRQPSRRARPTSSKAPWPTPSPMPGCESPPRLAQRGRGPLHGHALGREAARPRQALSSARIRPRRPRPR